ERHRQLETERHIELRCRRVAHDEPDRPLEAEEGGLRGRVNLDAGVDVREHADPVAPVDQEPERHAEPDAELAILGVLESKEEIELEAHVAGGPRAMGKSE